LDRSIDLSIDGLDALSASYNFLGSLM